MSNAGPRVEKWAVAQHRANVKLMEQLDASRAATVHLWPINPYWVGVSVPINVPAPGKVASTYRDERSLMDVMNGMCD